MNPTALYFASGDSLYPGALLLMMAAVASFFRFGRRLRFLNSLVTWSGVAMIVIASPACFLAKSRLLLRGIFCMAGRKKSGWPVLDTVAHWRNRSAAGSATPSVVLRISSPPLATYQRDVCRSSSRNRRLHLLGHRPSHFSLAAHP